MPKFRVFKGHDAYVNYVAVIEAADKAEANELMSWRATSRNINWVKDGTVNEYDDFEPFMDMTEEVPEDTPEPENTEIFAFTGQQRDIILAALRHWQASTNISPEHYEIAENGRGRFLSNGDIDKLCEEINQ